MSGPLLADGYGDLLEADLGPGACGFFTTRGAGARARGAGGGGDPYAGWNLALHVGDDPQRVGRNRDELERRVTWGNRGARSGTTGGLAWMDQVHSAVVAAASAYEVPTADALVLDTRQDVAPAGACVLVADCVPLLLASGDGALLAAVHAGRRGMLDGVVPATVDALVAAGARVADLWAATGPSICSGCYEVSERMHAESAQREPACAAVTRWGTPGLDVAAGVVAQLERCGIERISTGSWCTYEDPGLYSYRRDGRTGRLAGVVVPRRV
ncbi:polyphenol oxidase family protein [Actinomyces wuliandei]|uniref:polyphenol oxidase family protein n=1 Tax=Actinomyces wuliandei TaxID=2057743 RepID=UPI00214AA4FE|nr:polyphenol oxidase family protein [Actinomyces wuliandei]